MSDFVVGIWGSLVKEGEKDIHLFIYRDWIGSPSPCFVITNGWKEMIGGGIEDLDALFDEEVRKHTGYDVRVREKISVRKSE